MTFITDTFVKFLTKNLSKNEKLYDEKAVRDKDLKTYAVAKQVLPTVIEEPTWSSAYKAQKNPWNTHYSD